MEVANMNYIKPKYQLSNRQIARKYVKEVEKVNQILWPIENAFLTCVFESEVEYEELYTFHLEYFVKSVKMIQNELKYSELNEYYFEMMYKSVI